MDRLRSTRFGARLLTLECAVLLLGALLFSPAIRAPLFLDDFIQRSMVEGSFPAHRGPFDLYDFIADDNRAVLLERGFLPWWTDKHLLVRFFRPLSSALLYVEHRVFDHAPLPMHLLSFAWWIGAALAARALFRRLLPARAARFAFVIFALAPCHALPIAWIANRETLQSLLFGALGLVAYVRWREARKVRDAGLTALLFAIALSTGGEYALAFGGYIFAFETVTRGEPLGRRLVGWLPFIAPVAAYLALRGGLGYGAVASGFYTDPIHEPLAYVASAPMRAFALLGSGWLTLSVSWWTAGSIAPRALVAIVVLFGLSVTPVVRRVLGALDAPTRRSAIWLLVGSLIAMLPVLASAPSPRLLGTSMLGIASIVGLVLDHVWFPVGRGGRDERDGRDVEADEEAPRSGSRLAPLVAVGLGFAHLVHGPGSAFLSARAQREAATDLETRVAFVRDNVSDAVHAEVGAVRALASVFFMPFALDAKTLPPRWFVLSQAGHVLALRRDARTVDLVTSSGGIYPAGERNLYRAAHSPMRKGDTFRAQGLRVTVLEANAEGPSRVRFVFDKDPGRIAWIADDYDGVRLAPLPKIGFGVPFDSRDKALPR